jgi:hypothetical protein
MHLARFDGSTDWEAPARVVEAAVLRAPNDSTPLIERAAIAILGLVAGLALVFSVAAHALT